MNHRKLKSHDIIRYSRRFVTTVFKFDKINIDVG